MSLASVKCILKQLATKLRIPSSSLVLHVDGKDVTRDGQLRAGDFADKHLHISSNVTDCNSSQVTPTKPKRFAPKTLSRIDDVEVSFGRALYDFQVAGQQHLSFSKGDIIEVTEKHLDGWWNGKTNKTTGIFPASFIEEMSEEQVIAAVSFMNGTNTTTEGATPLTEENSWTPQKLKSPKKNPKRTNNFLSPISKLSKLNERQRKQSIEWGSPEKSVPEVTQRIQGSLKEGLLKKECSGGRLWNTRYFVLHPDRVVYYKTGDARPPPAGVLCFTDLVFAAISTKRSGYCFTLQGKPGKRSYHVMTRSRDDMNDWIQQTNQALRLDKRNGEGRQRSLSNESSVRRAVTAACLEYLISNNRFKLRNLLRASGNEREVKQSLEQMERGELPDIELIPSPHTVVSLLKSVLRTTDQRVPPMFPGQVITLVHGLISQGNSAEKGAVSQDLPEHAEDRLHDIKTTLLTLDSDRFNLAKSLVRFFALLLSGSEENSVTTSDVARTFGVMVFEGLDVTGAGDVLEFLVKYEQEIFK